MENDEAFIKAAVKIHKHFITISKQRINREKQSIEKNNEEIKNLQNRCKHKYKTVAAYAGHIVQCSKCGHETGA